MHFDFEKIQGAIFDIDGTILDSMPIWQDVAARYLRSIDVVPEDQLGEIVFSMTIQEGCHYIRRHYHLQFTEEEIEAGILELIKRFYYDEVVAKQGAAEFIQTLASHNIPMVLATTGDEELAEAALRRLGLWEYFSKLLTCGAYHTNKGEPLIFELAQRQLEDVFGTQLRRERIFVFEDSLKAIRTSKQMGFTVVGIADDASKTDWKTICYVSDFFCDSLDDLMSTD